MTKQVDGENVNYCLLRDSFEALSESWSNDIGRTLTEDEVLLTLYRLTGKRFVVVTRDQMSLEKPGVYVGCLEPVGMNRVISLCAVCQRTVYCEQHPPPGWELYCEECAPPILPREGN